MNDFDWSLCSTTHSVVDDRGGQIGVDTVVQPLDSFDLLFLPGGVGTRTLQNDHAFIEWLKTAYPARLKVSACTGALLLGAAGFLRGRRATTHPSAYPELQGYCGSVVRDRVVVEGDIVTAGGVSSAIDVGLHIVQKLAGADARSRIASQMDYPYRRNL